MQQSITGKTIPKGANILVVDVEDLYLEDDWIFNNLPLWSDLTTKKAKQRIESRYYRLLKKLVVVKKKGCKIYATAEKNVWQPLSDAGVITEKLPYWQVIDGFESIGLTAEFLEKIKKIDGPILICGLWKELCIKNIYDFMRNAGIECYVIDDKAYTIEYCTVGYKRA